MYIIDVSPKIIKNVMEWYGESLSDLAWVSFESFFEDYIAIRLPARYQQWKDTQKSYHTSVLFDWSNSRLEGLITEEEHDRILADFCNQNAEANKLIQRLLDDMK